MRLLTWNLFHGRDHLPGHGLHTWRSRLLRTGEHKGELAQVNRGLFEEFAAWIASRDWDVALLQEAPPRWLRPLAERCGADGASVLTSRNSLAFARAAAASLNPDLIASGEGGSNQLLVRPPLRALETRRLTLTERPERRCMLWARIEGPQGRLSVANMHVTAGDDPASARDVLFAAENAVEWAGGDPLVLGGDFNLRPAEHPEVFGLLESRFGLAHPTGPKSIDHLLVRGADLEEPPRAFRSEERMVEVEHGRRVRLSDHAPVVAALVVR